MFYGSEYVSLIYKHRDGKLSALAIDYLMVHCSPATRNMICHFKGPAQLQSPLDVPSNCPIRILRLI